MSSRPTRRRPALIVLVLLSAFACLALGWWQWQRFESVGGTGQNLGYALQWPLFAGFVIYAYRRFVRLEDGDDSSPTHSIQPEKNPREIDPTLLPQRPVSVQTDDDDPERREYNRYLADLARQSQNRNNHAQ